MILSCSHTTQSIYVVLTDVPEIPSITILPANNTAEERYFSNEVEAYITNLGVKTISQPMYREVDVNKQFEETPKNQRHFLFPGFDRWAKYFVLDNTTADYVVFTYMQTRQVKLIKKENKQVLSSFVLNSISKESPEIIIEKVLISAGILTRSN